jgi:hypothetical protein
MIFDDSDMDAEFDLDDVFVKVKKVERHELSALGQ